MTGNSGTRSWTWAAALVALLGAAVCPCAAGEPADGATSRPGGERVGRWVDELSSGEAAVRDEARERLMGLRREDLGVLREVVRRSRPLLPSQRAVLHDVVVQAYLSGEPYQATSRAGFMGVRLSEVTIPTAGQPQQQQPPEIPGAEGLLPPPAGVVVMDRLPGLGGFRALQTGDVVVGVEQDPPRRVRQAEDLQQAIADRRAGEIVRLRILRQGQERIVPVTLDPRPVGIETPGGFEDLQQRWEQKAELYWERTFLPLLEEPASEAGQENAAGTTTRAATDLPDEP